MCSVYFLDKLDDNIQTPTTELQRKSNLKTSRRHLSLLTRRFRYLGSCRHPSTVSKTRQEWQRMTVSGLQNFFHFMKALRRSLAKTWTPLVTGNNNLYIATPPPLSTSSVFAPLTPSLARTFLQAFPFFSSCRLLVLILIIGSQLSPFTANHPLPGR